MAATNLFPFIDRILEGRLAELLEAWRSEGLSHNAIARRLHDDYEIDVTAETVRRWVKSVAEAVA